MSFAKLLTTVLLAVYTLAAPLAIIDTATNAIDNTINSEAIASPIGGGLPGLAGPILGDLPIGGLVKRDGSLPVVEAFTNTIDNVVGSDSPLLAGTPIAGGLLGGLGGSGLPLGLKRDVPSTTMALSHPAIAALIGEGSKLIAVSLSGEVHDVTDIFKPALSTRELLTDISPELDALRASLGLNSVSTRNVPRTTALSHEAIAELLQKGGKLVVVEPSDKVHDITSVFKLALSTRTVGDFVNDLKTDAQGLARTAGGAAVNISGDAADVPLVL